MARKSKAEKQQWLIPYVNPLLKRLGPAFFKAVPSCPGVYVMLGVRRNILYIGKAKNLRVRLNSYKRARPGDVTRKVMRLIQAVREIQWEEYESEQAALLRENYLLRNHKPPFNVVNTHPEAYYFITIQVIGSQLQLKLTTHIEGQEDLVFGAYKGRGLVRQGYSALLRLMWLAHHPLESGMRGSRFPLPSILVRRKPAYSFHLSLSPELSLIQNQEWIGLIEGFLKGTTDALLMKLTEALLEKEQIPSFFYAMIQEDLETLQEFFTFGPRRNQQLIQFHGKKEHVIPQLELDDLLVMYQLAHKE